MWLRKPLLFAMLFAIVALAKPGRVSVCKAEFDAPKPITPNPNTLLRVPAPVNTGSPSYGSRPASEPSRRHKAFRGKGVSLPASFLHKRAFIRRISSGM